jgi:aspartyl-tRNA(Asn)/glutamyl-tRNA(Gln) amidotransferase subunit A
MSGNDGHDAQDGHDARVLSDAIADTAPRLHGIASRSDPLQIAREVLRLNDAVRAVATPARRHYADQPADYMAALLRLADASNEDRA